MRPPVNPDFRDLLAEFNARGVEYLVVGAHALAAHGLVRATKDLDLWVRPGPANAARVLAALQEFGAPLHDLTLDAEYRGRHLAHWGLVLTSNRTFPRCKTATVGALVKALDELLRAVGSEGPSSKVIWLQRSE